MLVSQFIQSEVCFSPRVHDVRIVYNSLQKTVETSASRTVSLSAGAGVELGASAVLAWADVELALLLLFAKSSATSHWQPYLAALLPAPLVMPLEWDVTQVAAAATGTQFGRAQASLRSEVERTWKLAVAPALCRQQRLQKMQQMQQPQQQPQQQQQQPQRQQPQ